MWSWNKLTRITVLSVCLAVLVCAPLRAASDDEKRPFTIDDYAHWRSIVSTAISADGIWVTFAYRKTRSDDEFVVRSTEGEKEHAISGASNPQFTEDSLWLGYIQNLPWKEAEKLRKQKKPVPKKAVLLNLATGEKTTFPNASSFLFDKKSGFMAVKKDKADPKAKHRGSDLILVDLKTGAQQNLGNVAEHTFNKPGSFLAYTVDAADKAGNGLYLLDLTSGSQSALDTGEAEYAHPTWNEQGTALAALRGTKQEAFREKDNILLAYTGIGSGDIRSHRYDPAQDKEFPEGMVISERASGSTSRFRRSASPARGNLFWDEQAAQVFCGIKEQDQEPKTLEEGEDPPADVDVWHWKDEYLQSVQKIRASRDRNFTYRSVYNLESARFIRLCDERMRTASVTRDGRWAVGQDSKAYISDWKESQADYYRVDTRTGERTLMLKAQKRTLGLSPDSAHFLYWKDGHIWDYVLDSGRAVNLTARASVSFEDDDFDHPGTRPPFGITGWSKDRQSVILTHKYDLYRQPLDGSPAVNLTGNTGSEQEIRFRYIQTDPEEKFIDLENPLLLSAFGRWDKQAGFFRLERDKLEKLIYDKNHFGRPLKAKKADRYLFTMESFLDFPDYYVAGDGFQDPRRLTEANPHRQEFRWGHNLLVEYTNSAGRRLQGVLMVPDDREDGERLPMLVDFYEKNSHNLYRFSRLVYRDTPMFYKYVSNGYLVLLPDVHFNTRTTHSDMLDCVEAAVRKVIDMGYADPARIGLHGHSFSGQGAAFISTQSKMFAAIVAGAAATNLISDFNQLWKSSGTNQHRYDYYGQGRFGTNPFDDLELYMRESALFNAATMDTPLLILHGTADGSVEWLQGIEFYNALRFLGKNVILLSYPGQGHHATKLENQIDFQKRMEQFYDHYLLGKPAPDWMTNGIPYLKKATENIKQSPTGRLP